MPSTKRKRGLAITVGVVAAYAVGTVVAVRQGYKFGRSVPVRCRRGHLFTTTWIPAELEFAADHHDLPVP
jgi:hypothetical protein